MVAATLKETGLEPHRLELEITETLLLGNTASHHGGAADAQGDGRGNRDGRFRHRLFEPQLSVALPVRQDQDRPQLHAGLRGSGRDAETVVKTIIGLGRELNMRVTVEGVETAAQAAFLDKADGDQVQGFFFGRPVPGSEVSAYILADFQKTHPALSSAGSKLRPVKSADKR